MRIQNHLRYKSRFSLPQDLTCLVDEFMDWQITYGTKQIELGTTFLRARIEDVESAGPFTKDDMGAPQPDKHPQGVSIPMLSHIYIRRIDLSSS
jgi:hypothetical protein